MKKNETNVMSLPCLRSINKPLFYKMVCVFELRIVDVCPNVDIENRTHKIFWWVIIIRRVC